MDDDAKIQLNDKDSKLSELKKGDEVTVTCAHFPGRDRRKVAEAGVYGKNRESAMDYLPLFFIGREKEPSRAPA
jgi:hypothetical protein